MKHVQHICQQQNGLGCNDDAHTMRFVPRPERETVTLACSRWKPGKKVTIKLSFCDADQKPTS
jgi:hypothetical protein